MDSDHLEQLTPDFNLRNDNRSAWIFLALMLALAALIPMMLGVSEGATHYFLIALATMTVAVYTLSKAFTKIVWWADSGDQCLLRETTRFGKASTLQIPFSDIREVTVVALTPTNDRSDTRRVDHYELFVVAERKYKIGYWLGGSTAREKAAALGEYFQVSVETK